MKNHFVIFFLIFLFAASFLMAQTIVNDVNFENYLETHAADGSLVDIGDAKSMGDGIANNNRVLNTRISNVLLLDLSGLNISDITGIAGFISLETLICSNNELTTLNVSTNVNLKSLLCASNFLTGLLLNSNTNLETLNCSNNQIKNLDLASNTLLKSLSCSGNQLSQIDLVNNSDLTFLSLLNNRITGELVVSNNTNLESLFCSSNQISILDLGSNKVLKNLDVSNNLISTLDLSQINTQACPDTQPDPPVLCQGDASINVSRNRLVDLIVSNGFNSSILTFNSEDNPDLVCIKIDSGFTPSLAWEKDDWAYYTAGACADIYTYIPDNKFEEALISLGHDSGVLDNLVLTANISTLTDLVVSGESISDLTGIADFVALTNLDCSNNDLTNLDLSANVNLTTLNCSSNILPSLDVSANTLLENLNCSSQDSYDDVDNTKDYTFDSLNINSNVALLVLNCSNNNLTALNLSNNNLLTNLDCSVNSIEALNVSANGNLTRFLCNDNSLFALNLKNGNNTAINTFNADVNPNLYCIEVDAIPVPITGWVIDVNSSYSLACGTYVPDDSFETYLETHNASGGIVTIGDAASMGDGFMNNFVPTAKINTVTTLNVSNLIISNLTGIEDFVGLLDLNCSSNTIMNLDLSNNGALTDLNCAANQIENLDLTLNSSLINFSCANNSLFTLNIKNGAIAKLNLFDATINPNLYCIEVDNETVANAKPITDWKKDGVATYSINCGSRITIIIDNNFEQALIDLGLDLGPLDDQVLTANIEHLLSLDVSDKNIADLSGIQDFGGLKELDCSGNSLNELDVSNMINLELLNCNSNYFLTNNSANATGVLNTDEANGLKRIFCASNLLSDINVSNKLLLEELDCGDNSIGALNVIANTELRLLSCTNNKISNLNISQNSKLEEVSCDSNQIRSFTTGGTSNSSLKKLSCGYNSISVLDVSNYLALETLNCRDNKLTLLNLIPNTALVSLDFSNNNIDAIDLKSNISLVSVFATQNNLIELDLSTNTVLKTLNCDSNQIANLVIDNAVSLKYLFCSANQLTDLDLSNNINLVELNVSSNTLSTLTLATNLSELKTFNCSDNSLTSDLDLSSMGTSVCPPVPNDPNNQEDYCPETIVLNVSGNFLKVLNIQNTVNANISSFNGANNPNLECIQVDDAGAIGVGWLKDASSEYSVSCRFGETYVPDNNFETRLITLGYDALPLDNYVLTSEIDALTSLDVSGEGITDLTGIEDFVALETLNCSDNVLTDLDIKKNIALTDINCSNNNLLNIDFSKNLALITIDCSNNSLTNLNLTANGKLLNLNISNNSFSSFLPSAIPSLQDFNCDSNQLTNLDLSSNSALTALSCEYNVLQTLNVKNGQNSILNNLNAQNNIDLMCIVTDTGNVPSGFTWLKDTTAEYAINCYYGQTYVPDDAFELALMALGLDDVLDDYVVTANIENISFLNISSKGISDLTGIEDFISLTNLNFEGNTVANLDLGSNLLLLNINASNNTLTDLDVSFATNIVQLNLSDNGLTQLNLDFNTELVELNISNNAITTIDIGPLTKLEVLDCSLNQLEHLDATVNVNLKELYCQSNRFIQDKLNIKNGANQSLEKFNATNNRDLACILVDAPFTVITNETGVYDNWFKDVTSNYQTVCEDADNDGVANTDDQCPGTPFGDAVDLFGCSLFSLPNNNFTVLITGETCLNNNDGKINITTLEYYNYTATLINDNFNKEYHFTNEIDILNLLAGSYQMCITIEEKPDFEICYDVVISQPEPLGVITSKQSKGKVVSINMSGSSSYNIDFNGLKFSTSKSSLTLSLQDGENQIKVSTDVECQGAYEETILVTDSVFVYPNPFQEKINLYTGNNESIEIRVYSYLGQIVYSNNFTGLKSNEVEVDTSLFSIGIYMVTVESESSLSTFKIVKK
jgi:Leucine-rich repeat (LRR) protein